MTSRQIKHRPYQKALVTKLCDAIRSLSSKEFAALKNLNSLPGPTPELSFYHYNNHKNVLRYVVSSVHAVVQFAIQQSLSTVSSAPLLQVLLNKLHSWASNADIHYYAIFLGNPELYADFSSSSSKRKDARREAALKGNTGAPTSKC